ncbi:MAG: PilT/PilU family type 4a pilus ATPase [Myxococcales bacterium]|nr:PilT/PilU family type 4a pilus ATPase [Myxococcales bacterium]MBP6844864.1 PilT/PilU family type 4a pilus ATPase [Kofleriaceae bacterium]
MSQLAKLVEFLGRDDVTEVVLATGRPVSVKSGGQFRAISRANLSLEQLEGLVADSPLAPLLAHQRGGTVTLEGQPVAVDVQAMGDERVVRLTRAARPKAKTHAPKPDSQRAPRVKRPTTKAAPIAVPHVAPPAPAAPPPAAPPPAAPAERPRMRVSQGDPGFVTLVRAARDQRATDLHVAAERPAMARILGTLIPQGATLSAATVERMLAPLLDDGQRRALTERGYVDSALDVTGAGRLRANIARVRGGWKGSFRLIAMAPPTLEQLGLPKELARITTYHQGLVVIAGPNGHGKTTTLAALVDLINGSKAHHILTIEDPVEIIHPRKRSVVSQREVGSHTKSFAAALKASLREDPDVIVIGELRDRETVEIALTAAETGHLVMATMSTPSAAKTLDRLIDMFPADEQQQVRSSLAAALKFVLAQRLLATADGQGVVAAVELLTGVLPLAALIRDNKLFQVASLQQRGRAFGMIRMDDSLAELVRSGRVPEEVAMRASENKRELANLLHPGAAAAAAAASAAAANPAGKGIAGLQSRLGGLFKKGEG